MRKHSSMIKWLLVVISGVLFLAQPQAVFAQEYKFNYQRELKGITDTWHTIEVPTEVYSKINSDFSDIRIIGITASRDTIEAPYIVKEHADVFKNNRISFNRINEVNNKQGYFYTFELPSTKTLNSVELDFETHNFNWQVTLEGSQNQQEWFTILNKSRIVGIENDFTSYKFTALKFKNVSYKYLRLKIPTATNPLLKKVIIEEQKVINGVYNEPNISQFKVVEKKNLNQTEVLVSLKQMMPISFINLQLKGSINYYRPIKVEYANDSIKNNTGWHYLYKHLFNSTLSSLNKDGFHFSNRTLKYLRITIDNADNEPLHFSSIKLHGNPHSLVVRFTKPATYYWVYGNSQAYVPNYDITRFEENIPEKNQILQVGNEQHIEQIKEKETDPLFKNDLWLWAIMILVIFILGWFSFKMLKN